MRKVLLLAMLVALAGCARQPKPLTFSGPTMGTTYHVTVAAVRNEGDERRVRQCIDDVLRSVDQHLSTYSATSEISRFNRSASTDWVVVSDPLFAVIAAARRVSVETDGAFDVTIPPLLRLWGFGPQSALQSTRDVEPPDPEFIHDAQASVGYRWLELRTQPDRAVRKTRVPLELDVDGIAPGYAVDRISDCLSGLRLPNHLVEIGGEVRAMGVRDDGRPWQVAVEAPLTGERKAYAGLQLTNLSVSTSGNYRDFRRLTDGRVVSHTLDPRTGEPVTHDVVSVTVVLPRAILADAYATALLVLGPEEGYALADAKDLPALFLERTGQPGQWRERATPAFERLRRPVD
ncbi:MAG TPA: FAD:protein FMN transferase [Steroidobacteraceae bacterium]